MKWTQTQNEAIVERNKNLLVAAAAGSGKTAVLVERIKRLVIDEKTSIDRFLILTFTNAAASEMKEKIVKALNAEILKDNENRAFLKKQLSILNTANISTFHAFAQEVIRKFFQIVNLDPSLRVCDEAQQTLLKNRAMEDLFLEEFENGNADFISFLNSYASSKNENAAKAMVSTLSAKMESLISPKEWLYAAIENLNLKGIEFEDTVLAQTTLRTAISEIERILYLLERLLRLFDDVGFTKAKEATKDICELFKNAKKHAQFGKFHDVLRDMENIEFFDITQKRFGKEYKAEIAAAKELGANNYIKKAKELQKSVVTALTAASNDTAKVESADIYAHAKTLCRLVLSYYQNYQNLKLEKNLMDFTDIERYAIKILENAEVAKEYQDKFEYIFIDEYQDSNPIQEKLIGLIKRENNVFMVGDVKQSIYKFRQAEPKLFEDKYRLFRDGTDEFSKKIDLNANFRSKKTVIDSVNAVFSVLMGESYDEAAKLNVGIEYEGEYQYKTQIHIIEDEPLDSEEADEKQDELLDELDKYEKEAAIIANIVKDTLGKKIYDVKNDCVREIELRDIVILLRNARGVGEKFQATLEMYGIPSYIGDSEGYFDTLEIQIIINFLKVIDNRRSDIPLISVLTSSVFNFTYEEIAQIRIQNPDGTFFDAFSAYSESNEKAAAVFHKLDEWAKLSEVLSISDFIWELMSASGYYLFVSALPKGLQRQANLRMLLEKAKDFQGMNIRGLHEFLEYVDALKAKAIRIGQVSTVSEEDNVLRIMTIHKSKGLEFPVVIVAGLGRKWKNSKESVGIVFNKDMGFAFEFSDPQKHYKRKTAWQSEIIKQNEREILEEEKRILYVAFTRAQDKLVLVGSVKSKSGDEEKTEAEIEIAGQDVPSTYLDMVMMASENSKEIEIIKHKYDEIVIDAVQNDKQANGKLALLKQLESSKEFCGDEKLYESIGKRLSFGYEYAQGIPIKSKFSVTELNADVGEKQLAEINLDEPNFGERDTSLTRAGRGTIYHTLLEHWDFAEACKRMRKGEAELKSYACDLLAALTQKNILFEGEAKLCEEFFEAIFWLSQSEIGERMAKAKVLKKEASFILDKEIDGQSVIVQGTIDSYFEDEAGLVLLDYKTGNHQNIAEDILKSRYQKQIELYKEALSKSFEKPVSEAYLVFPEDKKILKM